MRGILNFCASEREGTKPETEEELQAVSGRGDLSSESVAMVIESVS